MAKIILLYEKQDSVLEIKTHSMTLHAKRKAEITAHDYGLHYPHRKYTKKNNKNNHFIQVTR